MNREKVKDAVDQVVDELVGPSGAFEAKLKGEQTLEMMGVEDVDITDFVFDVEDELLNVYGIDIVIDSDSLSITMTADQIVDAIMVLLPSE